MLSKSRFRMSVDKYYTCIINISYLSIRVPTFLIKIIICNEIQAPIINYDYYKLNTFFVSIDIFRSGLGSSLAFTSLTSVKTLFFLGGTGMYSLLSITSYKFFTKLSVSEMYVVKISRIRRSKKIICMNYEYLSNRPGHDFRPDRDRDRDRKLQLTGTNYFYLTGTGTGTNNPILPG